MNEIWQIIYSLYQAKESPNQIKLMKLVNNIKVINKVNKVTVQNGYCIYEFWK